MRLCMPNLRGGILIRGGGGVIMYRKRREKDITEKVDVRTPCPMVPAE
jgi:hypothetical protein